MSTQSLLRTVSHLVIQSLVTSQTHNSFLDNIVYYKCDVSKWEEVERVSKEIVNDLGHPTILINNAGVVQGKRILDLSPEDIQQYV